MRKVAALLLGASLMAFYAPTAQAGAPVVIMEDAKGDAGVHSQGVPIPQANEEGFDLVGSTIARVKKDLVFSVTHDQMPGDGQPGELFRLLYHFTVDGVEWRFTVKTLDIGKPDVIARTGTERIGQVYENVVRLEQCAQDTTIPVLTLNNCGVLKMFEGKWDAATKSITWTIPMVDLKVVTGSVIGPTAVANPACHICWVPHYLERSLTPSTIIDEGVFTATYVVPKR